MAEFIEINPQNPQPARIKQAVDVLRDGGLIIYPTDTVYGIGCDLYNHRAIQNLCRLKGIKPDKLNLSFICYDLSHISLYARTISNPTFKLMKKSLPGPFTYILEASSKVPKILDVRKKQVGIRVPDHNIPREIVKELGNPIVNTSLKEEGGLTDEYFTDPELIFEKYQKTVDLVIAGGMGGLEPSTVVDCTSDDPQIVRQGKGDLKIFL